MQMKMKIGIGLIALGIGVWAAWSGWLRTRRFVPLEVAIRAAQGQAVQASLRLNFSGLYLIEIENGGAVVPGAQPGAIEAEWTVRRGTEEIARGNSREWHRAAEENGKPVRVIGEFRGEAGREYEVNVEIPPATGPMNVEPRLRVAVSGLARENLQAAGVLAFSTTFICELFGIILVGVGWWGKKKRVR